MMKTVNQIWGLNHKLKILVIIPTFNNIGTIENIVLRVVKIGAEFLVVNDGSNDGTSKLLNKLNVNHINFEHNYGKGAAIRTGLQWAKDHQFSHIITIDADGQHFPEDIIKFMTKIEENPNAIIIGNRFFEKKSSIPLINRLGQKLSNFSFKLLTGVYLPDTQCGFRAYPVNALSTLNCKTNGYEYELEALLSGINNGLQIIPIDISVHYSKATKQASHFKPFKDSLKIAKLLIRACVKRYFRATALIIPNFLIFL